MDSAPSNNKRSRDGSDNLQEETNKRIRTDIFIDLLDDDDDVDSERDAASEDIASVIKSLEDEIHFSSSTDLNYLLEASDDDLGLPPTTSSEAVESALVLDWETGGSGFGQIWGIEDEIPYGFGNEMGFEFYSAELFDFSGFSWRQDPFPAV